MKLRLNREGGRIAALRLPLGLVGRTTRREAAIALPAAAAATYVLAALLQLSYPVLELSFRCVQVENDVPLHRLR